MKIIKNKKILFISIDPIEYRRRVLNQIIVARESGFEISVISIGEKGKKYQESQQSFREQRIFVFFKSGPLKFIEFNLKLLSLILFRRYHIIHLRGLWVLPAVMIRQIFSFSHLVYDAHEYFAGLEILQHRPLRRQFWLLIEKISIPHIHTLITVSEPLGNLFKQRYSNLKNVIILKSMPSVKDIQPLIPGKYDKNHKRLRMIFHGYFLKGRALPQIIQALTLIKDISFELILMGQGPLKGYLESLTKQNGLEGVVLFHPIAEKNELLPILAGADVGLSLIEADCENRKYSLPNKFFELICAGVPVLASNIITQQSYVDKFELGITVDPQNIELIAKAMIFMLTNADKRKKWASNCLAAARSDLNWEKESEKLKQCYMTLRENG